MHNLSDNANGRVTHAKGTGTSTGTLTVIDGCMFSGKTTALLRRLSDAPPEQTAAFKHAIDRRYRADAIVSHNGLAVPAMVVSAAHEITAAVGEHVKLIGIDEAHFFDERLVAVVHDLIRRNIDVLTTSLDLDSWGRPFPVVEALARLADTRKRMGAVCARCGKAADRTQRTTPIVDGNLIGGSESFEPRCQACWHPPPEPPPH